MMYLPQVAVNENTLAHTMPQNQIQYREHQLKLAEYMIDRDGMVESVELMQCNRVSKQM